LTAPDYPASYITHTPGAFRKIAAAEIDSTPVFSDTASADDPSRTIKIGRTTIQLRRTTARNMATSGRLSGLLIQAFRELGQEHITPARRKHLELTIPFKNDRNCSMTFRLPRLGGIRSFGN
jgi:hypothetical protein